MKNIGLVDDKDASRRAFMLSVNVVLERLFPDWRILDSKPFKEYKEYKQWILENDISVLLIDERLDEGELEDGTFVSYFGSDLAKDLRNDFQDIPIYSVTNVTITEKLRKSLSYFNLIISKSKFSADKENYINMIVKSATKFYEEYKKEFNRLGELSEKIANSDYEEKDINEIQALQTKLAIPHISEALIDREQYLEKLDSQIDEIRNFQTQLTEYLKGK